MDTLTNLPEEMQIETFIKINYYDLINLSKTNKFLLTYFISSQKFWKAKTLYDYPEFFPENYDNNFNYYCLRSYCCEMRFET